MIDRSKQIIPDPNAVARCLDPKILELLGSHSTFTINELSQRIDPSSDNILSEEILNTIFDKIRPSNCDFSEIIKDINEAIKPLVFSMSTEKLNIIHKKISIDPRYGSSNFIKTIFLETICFETAVSSVANILINGTSVSLLQPDGKGWQKGKLKLCFEFVPEENEPVATKEPLIATHHSPLDEIRNSLIESN
jgi:KGK domain